MCNEHSKCADQKRFWIENLKKNKGFGGVDIHFDFLFRIKFTV